MSKAASPSLEESIQLAIDAAAAANDTVGLAAEVKAESMAAADRLDAFGKAMKPLMLGTLVGASLVMVLSGAVYFLAVSGLRSASSTQVEAISLLRETVGALETRLADLDKLDARLVELIDARDLDEAVMRSAMATELAAFKEAIDAEDEMKESIPQMLRSMLDRGEAQHEDTRSMMTDALSELQLALTRVLAERPAAKAPAPQAQSSQRATSATSPVRRPASRTVEPNPFKYP